MKQSFKKLLILAQPFLISSCGTMKMPDVSLPMLNGDYRELSTAPKDASLDRKSTRLNSSHIPLSRMPSSA